MIDVVVIKFEDDSKCNPHLFSLNLKSSIDVDSNSDCQLRL